MRVDMSLFWDIDCPYLGTYQGAVDMSLFWNKASRGGWPESCKAVSWRDYCKDGGPATAPPLARSVGMNVATPKPPCRAAQMRGLELRPNGSAVCTINHRKLEEKTTSPRTFLHFRGIAGVLSAGPVSR